MHHGTRTGQTIAAILAGAWRTAPPPLAAPTDALPRVLPLLQETGAGSLAYWRLCRSGPRQTLVARQLRQTYRLHLLQAAVFQKQLRDLIRRLRAVGVEPLVVKGWSISRLYPEPGLRPYGDIDLCVRPDDRPAAAQVLTRAAGACGVVDLHVGVADLDDRRLDDLYRRSRLLPLGDVEIRVPGAEDQLRHHCLHLMRHGAWRPLWLCDLGAALETLPPNFDWDYCRSGDPRLTVWMNCAIALACRLLDARSPCSPVEVPTWMTAAVLRLWRRGAAANDAVIRPWSACWRDRRQFGEALKRRWPNPIRAAFKLGLSPFSRCPLPLTQAAAFALRACQYGMCRIPNPSSEPFAVHPTQVR